MRKKSPRAPSIALEDAVDRAVKIYQKEKRHPAPADAIAQHLGYTGAKNGSAATVIATLRYYGLIERTGDGMISVSKDVESYMFAPNDRMKREFKCQWLKTPPVFAELVEQYGEQLPSDENLKYNLIQKGFFPEAADSCVNVFKKSMEFAEYSSKEGVEEERLGVEGADVPGAQEGEDMFGDEPPSNRQQPGPAPSAGQVRPVAAIEDGVDRIPVRLARGRRAWIEVPTPFYSADKSRLKKQIDLLLTDDEEEDELEG